MRKWKCNGVEFKSGDKVMPIKVGKTDDPNGMGEGRMWYNSWVPDMVKYIFNAYEIDYIDQEGAHFVAPEGEEHYLFPLNVLVNLTVTGSIDQHGNLIAEKLKEAVNG